MPGDKQSRNNPAVDAAIAAYLELLERGAVPDKAAFLARYPDIAGELRQFLDDYHSVKRNTAQRSDDDARTYSLHADPRPIGSVPVDEIRYFGDYELLEEIERGGMGIVFKARQKTLNRIVAVKLILAGRLASRSEVDRFYAEAQAAAKLDHRNIVPIYEVGEHRGQHYYSMAYVPGASLSLRLLAGPVPPREAATIIRDATLAVHYAHGQGVIHRDLKPANILMDADGEPRVTDFGLAKQISDESGLTATGQVLGTPSFMPPEQITSGIGEIGATSDVYSLGATLYALLVGRPPFQSASSVDTLKQVLEKSPVPLREFDAGVPKDLETIVLKCLEKLPAR